jgi:hypothetical protein
MSRATHLIIAGVTRAASTALFTYLGDHPDVCRSTIKETRFFLDADYPLARMHSYEEGIAAYETYYPHAQPGQIRLEATPDYLYTPDAADRIAHALPGAGIRIVFLLREPVARLISWYRYAKQNGRLAAGMSFEQFIEQQDEHGEQPMRALAQGRYSDFLPHWLGVFGHDRVLITTHEALQADASAVVRRVCRFAGIDPDFYDDYGFRVINESREAALPGLPGAQRAKHKLIWAIKPYVHDRPAIRGVLRKARRAVDAVLGSADKPDAPFTMSNDVRAKLEAYYADEPAHLAELLGVSSWMWDAGDQTPIGAAP